MKAAVTFLALGLQLASFTGIMGQSVQFDQETQRQSCDSPPGHWSAEGSVTLVPGQKRFFQSKAVVRAVKDLCTVDLTKCPPEVLPTSPHACYCKSKRGNKYDIHVGVEKTEALAGMTVQAMVPGNGVFHHMSAAAPIGRLPEDKQRLKVFYSVDGGDRDYLPVGLPLKVVIVCPGKRFLLQMCAEGGRPDASLKVKANGQVITSVGRCILHMVDPSETDTVVFEYSEEMGCHQVDKMFITENAQACQGRTETPAEVATTWPQVKGVCPATPRSLVTLPSGHQYLRDDSSFQTSWSVFGALTDDVARDTAWVVFQRRVTGNIDFHQNWEAYVDGFGNDYIVDDYWLGLEMIHKMCNKTNKCELLIHLKYDYETEKVPRREDGCYHARYFEFWLHGASDNYRLTVSGYTGTAGDSLVNTTSGTTHGGQQFTTRDRDNDKWASGNCASAEEYLGGWWYNACHWSNLNGKWAVPKAAGLVWYTLTGWDSAQFTEMKLRPWAGGV